jgi:hypothetical protein
MYLLRREDGKYVARGGLEQSYTKDIDKVRIYQSMAGAEKDRCGNENIVPIEELARKEGNSL